MRRSYEVGNRNFSSYEDAVKYCDNVDFDYDCIVEVSETQEINREIKRLECTIDRLEKEIDSIREDNKLDRCGFMFGASEAHLVCFSKMKEIDGIEKRIDDLYKKRKELSIAEHEKKCIEDHNRFNDSKYCIYYYEGEKLVRKEYVSSYDIDRLVSEYKDKQVKMYNKNRVNRIEVGFYDDSMQNSVKEMVIVLRVHEIYFIGDMVYIHKKEYDSKGRLIKHYINSRLFVYRQYGNNGKNVYLINGIVKIFYIGINLRNGIEFIDNEWFYYDSFLIFKKHRINVNEVLNNDAFKRVYNSAPADVREIIDSMLECEKVA